MNTELLTTVTLYNKTHFVSKYLKFIKSRTTAKEKYMTHLHHILPKAVDFFPEFTNLTMHKWNGVHLTVREHFIAHKLLHMAFPGSSQTLAFYNMSNILDKKNSRAYQDARKHHISSLHVLHKSSSRNAAISKALKGKSKSAEHIAKLVGHEVTESTREKLRNANLGKIATAESKAKMSASRLGKSRGAHSEEGKKNISNAKKNKKWFTDGLIEKQFDTAPDSTWNPGRKPK
jgi:hypothetical protein